TWYIILPPAKARFFISSQYVQKIGETSTDTAPESEYEEPAATTESAETKSTVAVTPETPAVSSTPKRIEEKTATGGSAAVAPDVRLVNKKPEPGVRSESDMLRQIRILEKNLMAENAKPMEQRDMHKLLAEAQAINVPDGSRFKPIYDSMVDFIKDEIKIADETRRTQELVSKTIREVNEPVKPQPAKPQTPAENVVIGKIQPSRVFDRYDSAIGQIYILRNPNTGEILTFARPADSTIDVNAYIGQVVRISGRKDFDRKAGVQIIKISDISPASAEDAVAKIAVEEQPESARPATNISEPQQEQQTEPATAENVAVKTPAVPAAKAQNENEAGQLTPEDLGMAKGISKPSIEDIDLPASSKQAQTPAAQTKPAESMKDVAIKKPELPPVESLPQPAPKTPEVAEKPSIPTPATVEPVEQPSTVVKPIASVTPEEEGPAPVEVNKIAAPNPVAATKESEAANVESPKIPEVETLEPSPTVAIEPKKTSQEAIPAVPEVKSLDAPVAIDTETEKPATKEIAVPPVVVKTPEVKPIEAPAVPTDITPKTAVAQTPSTPDLKQLTPPSLDENTTEVVKIDEEKLPTAPALKSITAPSENETAENESTETVKPIETPMAEETAIAKTTAAGPDIAAIPVPAENPAEATHRPKALKNVAVPTADMPIKGSATPVESMYEVEWD
ncbi:MAG TPA: hypothetical protein PLK08_08865, partial [Phycisphaerae bacterium]|nr:hypothetical protein [Phycisphaerae bacterium]